MEPLYTTTTTMTLEELLRFNRYGILRLFTNKTTWISTALVFLLAYFQKSILLPVIYVVLVLSFLILTPLLIKKQYQSRASRQAQQVTFKFYETYLLANTQLEQNKYFYGNLKKIKETKSNFYIMSDTNQGLILCKENCSPELLTFISNLKINHK